MPPVAPRTFRTLHQSPLVTVRDYCCRECRCGPGAEECSDANHIVLMRRGAFTMHFGRRQVTADTNHAVLFQRGSTYRVSHPADGGDRGTILGTSDRLLGEIAQELDPAAADRPGQPFAADSSPCDASMFWRHRELVQRLEHAPAEPLWAEAQAMQLIADAMTAAQLRHRAPPRQRRATTADHRDRVEAAKAFLATHLHARISLADVAIAAHTSPFHLARMFQRLTGMPVHRYHLQLRLRASLERLAGSGDDLTAIAHDLGFCSHSHFTDCFRRAFGRAPSQLRRSSSRRLAQMRKNLEA